MLIGLALPDYLDTEGLWRLAAGLALKLEQHKVDELPASLREALESQLRQILQSKQELAEHSGFVVLYEDVDGRAKCELYDRALSRDELSYKSTEYAGASMWMFSWPPS